MVYRFLTVIQTVGRFTGVEKVAVTLHLMLSFNRPLWPKVVAPDKGPIYGLNRTKLHTSVAESVKTTSWIIEEIGIWLPITINGLPSRLGL